MAKDPSKTEKATPKRIDKARKEGNVAKSQDVTKAITLLAGFIALTIWSKVIATHLIDIFRYFFMSAPTFQLTESNLKAMGVWLFVELAKMLLPFLLFVAVVTYIVLRVQVGKLWTTKIFHFKLSKFNIIKGIKRMFFSAQTLVRLIKNLLQALCIGFAPWLVIKAEFGTLPSLYDMNAAGVAAYILSIGSRMVLYALVPISAIAIFDLWYSRREYAENLKMTKDEIKDEHKQSEGDPMVKSKIKQKMLQMGAKRMMQAVPKADVVITNPTHIAVALAYNPEEASAPVVVAIGVNKVAEKIKAIARENNVPIKENKPLARALYKQTQVGDIIPADLFQAVAVILAQIWKTRPKKSRAITKK